MTNKDFFTNKILPSIGLIVLSYMFTGGQYLKALDGHDLSIILAFIDTIISTIVLLLIPGIIRLYIKKPFDYVKGSKICIANSLVLLAISLLTSNLWGLGVVSGIEATIYYFINMNLFSLPKPQTYYNKL